jgi:hypothetical protein
MKEKEMATDPHEMQENRLSLFANVFKGYMGIMPIVTAALAPLLTALNVVPTYEWQRKPIALGSITPGYRWIFNLSPLVLILGSIGCYIGYANTLETSLQLLLKGNSSITRTQALGSSSLDTVIPHSVELQLLYLGMFLCAEGAFVMMALRDYCNDVRHVSEYEWMFGAQNGSSQSSPKQ